MTKVKSHIRSLVSTRNLTFLGVNDGPMLKHVKYAGEDHSLVSLSLQCSFV